MSTTNQAYIGVGRLARIVEKVAGIEDRATRLEGLATSLRSEAAAIRGILGKMVGEPDLTIAVSERTSGQQTSLPVLDRPPVEEGKANQYLIQRGHFSYADVVWQEVLKSEFELTEAWETIKDKIVNQSSRGRDSCRHSLKNDSRFEWLRNRNGTWFRRRSPGEIRQETPAPESIGAGAHPNEGR